MPQSKLPTVKQRTKQRFVPEGRRWKKGQSGNPNGRPPNASCLTALLREEIGRICPADKEGRTWAELLVVATMRLALAGNSTALKEVWDRLDGKVVVPVDVAAPPIAVPLIKIEFVKAIALRGRSV